MRTVFATGGANPYKGATVSNLIEVQQSENKKALFDVHYGLQVYRMLTYSQACAKIGEAILHNACCEGLASNEGL